MKRIITVMSVMAIMAAMMVASALPALADPGGERGHCKEERENFTIERCAGGGASEEGGGGGGITETVSLDGVPFAQRTTGGGSDFRGTGEGGGGKCVDVFDGANNFSGCQTGKLAER